MPTHTVSDQQGNVLEETVDNGDGTGVHTDYTTTPPTVTEVSGLPVISEEVVIPIEETTTLSEVVARLPATNLDEANDILLALIIALSNQGVS